MKMRLVRDPVQIAIIGTTIGALMVLGALNLQRLPFLHPATTYVAEMANTGGLNAGDEVKVSGVPVGEVTSLRVSGAQVDVTFTVKKDLALGDQSTASVEVATVLGAVFLQVNSAGAGRMAAHSRIPIARTSVPFTLVNAFEAAGTTISHTDLGSLSASLTQLDQALSGVSSADVAATLRGLTLISNTMAGRADKIQKLLQSAQEVADVLNAKSAAIVSLLDNAGTFLAVLHERRDVITAMLADTAALGAQLRTLVDRNQTRLTPALANLDKVAEVLMNRRKDLERSITLLGQFTENIGRATSNGPWIDMLMPYGVIPDNVIARCGVAPTQGCGK